MENRRSLQSISDDELLRRLAELMRDSRRVESELVAHIAEVDERRLYVREASPSMFAYCQQVLHLSEAEAYLRITAARASRDHPMLLEMLADGRLHLSGIARLAPHLTRENAEGLLKRAVHKSKRQIEELVAELFPRPDAPAMMRKLPATTGQTQPTSNTWGALAGALADTRDERGLSLGPHGLAPSIQLRPDGVAKPERAVVQPLAPARYKVQFTASAELHRKLERLRALMRTGVPDGDLAAVIEEAVTEKLERLEARRFATTKAPKNGISKTNATPSSRRIPAAVRRAVYERDGSRCRYVDKQGRRCTERHRLEFHHCHPFALGGDHDPQKIRLMCHAHNQYVAEQDYGKEPMARYRRASNHGTKGGQPMALPRSDDAPRRRNPGCGPGPVHPGQQT